MKCDYCSVPDDQAVATERYAAMGAALRGTGREFLFSMCEWGGRAPHLFGSGIGAQMWRVTGDIFDSWVDVWMSHRDNPGYCGVGIDSAFDTADRLAEYAGAGAWNDLDMLVVGLKGKGAIGGGGLSFLEYQTHMSLWCLACSPLMIGCDVRAMDEQTRSLLTNPEVLAVNQDSLGKAGRRVVWQGDCEVWRKPLANGSTAAALFNRGSSGANVKLRAADIGLLDTPKAVRNLWKREDIADLERETTFRVQPHETVLLTVRG